DTIFNESMGGGINELLNEFWGAWEDLSASPGGEVERLALVSVSQSLASVFRQYSDNLSDVRKEADGRIVDGVSQVNEYTSAISNLNDKIVQIERGGDSANTLRDERSGLLKKLNKVVDVQYFEDSDGALNIFLSNGKPLVEGGFSWELD
ncbi:unnamed protein product, partial [marine sediment metagenome]